MESIAKAKKWYAKSAANNHWAARQELGKLNAEAARRLEELNHLIEELPSNLTSTQNVDNGTQLN